MVRINVTGPAVTAAEAGEYGLWEQVGRDAYKVGKDIYNRKRPRASDYEVIDMKRSSDASSKSEWTRNTRLKGERLTVGSNPEYTKSYHRYGKKARRMRIDRLIEATLNTTVARFQGLNPTHNTNRRYYLSVDTSQQNVTYLPMYAMNLTALPFMGQDDVNGPAAYTTVPFYRLVKYGTLGASQNYQWNIENGVQIDGSANNRWIREKGNLYNSVPLLYRHKWSDIQLLCEIPKRCNNMKVHMALVKFDNGCGPLRYFYKESDNTLMRFDEPVTASEQGSCDEFWESFWAHRVVHPLSRFQQANKSKKLRILKHTVITCTANDVAGTIPLWHEYKLWFDNDRIYNPCTSGQLEQQTTAYEGQMMKEVIPGDHAAAASYADYPHRTNTKLNTNCVGLFDDIYKDVWFVVWADKLDTPLEAGIEECSFDIKVRTCFQTNMNVSPQTHETIPGTVIP